MSDFVPRDILPDLWDEILKRHWSFLETEESLQKIEERKKLEGCLKEFLCIAPHDRKFFLPETAHVLRKSIREMDDFTAYKAIIGFESISQYANNLFTKPWRKEFRVLKMYSGFYQHEIKSNLLDAEKLFEAMGYRRLSDEILTLDGPICPDQVTNVSRDAMAAYVECQIMKHIYAGLVAMGIACTWQDVFYYREKCVGGTSQVIKGLSFALQERRLRKEKLAGAENCYAAIQHSPQAQNSSAANVSQCSNCAPYHMPLLMHHMQSQLPNQRQCVLHSANSGCALHMKGVHMYNGMGTPNGKLLPTYPGSGYHQQQHGFVAQGSNMIAQPHMSHSRSLEHYNEPAIALPHRHSFDHQQQGCTAHHYQPPSNLTQHVYESPYDCLDGVSMGSSVSYAAVAGPGATASGGGGGANCNVNAAYAHPYNVSGNRYPLPFNISSQLNSHYATPVVNCNGVKGEPYNNGVDDGYASVPKSHACDYYQSQQSASPLVVRQSSAALASKDFQTYRQRSFPPDHQLIDFDDRAPLATHDFHAQMHAMSQCNSFDYDRECERVYEHNLRSGRTNMATYVQPKDVVCQQHAPVVTSSQLPSSDDMYSSYVYARPVPRSSRLKTSSSNVTDKYLRNSELLQDCADNNGKQLHNMELKNTEPSGGRRKLATHANEVSDMSYESAFEDFVTVGHSEHPAQRSPTQASKNQDGVGSFESWNFVFQNLERSGYSKDLGERGDLLMQGLDLDSLTLTNGVGGGGGGSGGSGGKSTERRRANHVEPIKPSRPLNSDTSKTRMPDKAPSTALKESEKRDINKVGSSNNVKQEKSILKPQNTNVNLGTGVKKIKSALKSTTSIGAHFNNNNNGNNTPLSETSVYKDEQTGDVRRSTANVLRSDNRKQVAVPTTTTEIIVSDPKEWSCRFCTFLNPNAKRICEICCRSKDFNLEASVSHTPTCV